MTKSFPLYEGLFDIKRRVKDMIPVDTHIFIFVAGGSATGKTSRVANNIAKFFPDDSLVLSMDNYFKGHKYFNENNISFDEPEAVDIDLFVKHLSILKSGNHVKIPDYDFSTGISKPESILVKPKQIIIIEGLFALDHRFDNLSDLNIYVETSKSGRLIRRVLRDIKRTGQTAKEIVDYFVNTLNAMHEKYIEPEKQNADIIVVNEFHPYLETRGLDIDKFRTENNIPNFD